MKQKAMKKVSKSKIVNTETTSVVQSLFTAYQEAAQSQAKAAVEKKKNLKQLQSQLTQALNKRRTAKQKKIMLATKTSKSPTPAVIKQLDKVKESYNQAVEEVTHLQLNIESMRQSMRLAKSEAQKLAAIGRMINKFDKRPNKKSNKPKMTRRVAKAMPAVTEPAVAAAEVAAA